MTETNGVTAPRPATSGGRVAIGVLRVGDRRRANSPREPAPRSRPPARSDEERPPRDRPAAIGVYTAAMGSGFAVGPLIGSFVGSAAGYPAAYAVGAVIALAGAAFAWWRRSA